MKKLLLVAILTAAAAATALACGGGGSKEETTPSSGGATPAPAPGLAAIAAAGFPKKTAIHFTRKPAEDKSGDYDVPCIGVVTTERMYRDKGDKVSWKVKKNNGESHDDECDDLVMTQVNLRFTNPNAVSPNPAYADVNGDISVTVSSSEPDYNGSRKQKYQVYIGNDPAGPDPIIIVNCGSCGPDGGPG